MSRKGEGGDRAYFPRTMPAEELCHCLTHRKLEGFLLLGHMTQRLGMAVGARLGSTGPYRSLELEDLGAGGLGTILCTMDCVMSDRGGSLWAINLAPHHPGKKVVTPSTT